MQTTKKCFILRRSVNTNSFGLRGIWVLEVEPTKIDGEDRHRVYSFGVNQLDGAVYQLGAVVDVPYVRSAFTTPRPAHELCELQYNVKARDAFEFVKTVNPNIATLWAEVTG